VFVSLPQNLGVITEELEKTLTPEQWKKWHTRLTVFKAWPAENHALIAHNTLVIWVNAMVKLTNPPRDPGPGHAADLSFFKRNLPILRGNLSLVATASPAIAMKLTKELSSKAA
tara:strand:- start:171 stop:512 length:342 start_codon:yes stop_codon:yes gene_type:complete